MRPRIIQPGDQAWLGGVAVYLEARGEPPRGQRAVAHVILNRVYHGGYPSTVEDVVLQDQAFSPFMPTDPQYATAGQLIQAFRAWERAQYEQDFTGGATAFHAITIPKPDTPYWHGMIPTIEIGEHRFYREKRCATNSGGDR